MNTVISFLILTKQEILSGKYVVYIFIYTHIWQNIAENRYMHAVWLENLLWLNLMLYDNPEMFLFPF